jgi:hypothetical protein
LGAGLLIEGAPGVVVDDLGPRLEDVIEDMQRVHQADGLPVLVVSLRQVQVPVAVQDAEHLLELILLISFGHNIIQKLCRQKPF